MVKHVGERNPDATGGSGARFIRRLVLERRAAGLTQAQVAAAMGVRQSVVSEIESGRVDVRLSTLERYIAAASRGALSLEIATALELDVDRAEIRRAIRMSDLERERYYLASNANMLRMFAEGRPG